MKMKYVGNFRHLIKDEWIEEVMKAPGKLVPKDYFPEGATKYIDANLGDAEYNEDEARWFESGYKVSDTFFSVIYDCDLNFKIDLPFASSNAHLWFTRMEPGQFIPIHVDRGRSNAGDNLKGYWMAWTDWEPGHVFMYEDEAISGYKVGDVYIYEDPRAIHCAVNIGMNTRLALQIKDFE
jgi:hypothetical protein